MPILWIQKICAFKKMLLELLKPHVQSMSRISRHSRREFCGISLGATALMIPGLINAQVPDPKQILALSRNFEFNLYHARIGNRIPWGSIVSAFEGTQFSPRPDPKQSNSWYFGQFSGWAALLEPDLNAGDQADRIRGTAKLGFDSAELVWENEQVLTILFKLLKTQNLVLGLAWRQTPLNAFVWADESARGLTPNLFRGRDQEFVVQQPSELKRIISDGIQISQAILKVNSAFEFRKAWAKPGEVDQAAFSVFLRYLQGQAPAELTFNWASKKLTYNPPDEWVERYSVVVDWRQEDDATAAGFAQSLSASNPMLVQVKDEIIWLNYKGKSKAVTAKQIGKERYVVIHAVAELLRGDFEIRVTVDSRGSDTHAFAIAPSSFWSALDSRLGAKAHQVIRPIKPHEGFYSWRR